MRIYRAWRRVNAWARAIAEVRGREGAAVRLVGVTLTYHYGEDWKALAISDFMGKIKKMCGKGLLAYVWVSEIQLRGAIHYHIVLLVRRGTKIEYPDKAGLWNNGSTKVETIKSPFYLIKYVGKGRQKTGEYPKGARVCGAFIRKGLLGDKELADYKWDCQAQYARVVRDEVLIPMGLCSETDGPTKVRGRGGYHVNGVHIESPYELESYQNNNSQTRKKTGSEHRWQYRERVRRLIRAGSGANNRSEIAGLDAPTIKKKRDWKKDWGRLPFMEGLIRLLPTDIRKRKNRPKAGAG